MSEAGPNREQINWQPVMASLMQKMEFTMNCLVEDKVSRSRVHNICLSIFKGTFQEDVDEWLDKCKQIVNKLNN